MSQADGPTTSLPPVRKSVRVELPPEAAFELFTAGIARWWPLAAHSVSRARATRCAVEPRVGGALYEVRDNGTRFAWGTVLVWEPPRRFVATWHPGREPATAQEIEVRFVADGPGTRVELEHRGWATLADRAASARDNYDRGWDGVLACFVAAAGPPGPPRPTARPLDPAEAAAILGRTPAVLDHLLRGLPEAWVHGHEGGESWSPFDVVGHLLHGEEVNWIPRARTILERGEDAPFEPFDRVAFFEKSKGKRLVDLLDGFAAARARSLRDLEAMPLGAADLARPGRHPDFGRVTLGELLATWVAHDLNHLGQIVTTMAKQYDAAVGPWKAYLGILTR
jgi:uncharacterized protein YndB with AHSA1/START domain